jgi:outer membrane protein insertion porin family
VNHIFHIQRYLNIHLQCAILLGCLSLSACRVTQHLRPGERLLTDNALTLNTKVPMRLADRSALTYQMEGLYKQKPNKKWLGQYARLWRYYKYKDRTSKFARWTLRRLAEPPTIYDADLTSRTAGNLENSLRQRGYFRAVCTHQVDTLDPYRMRARYILNTGPLFAIDTITFDTRDTNILAFLDEIRSTTLLKYGLPVSSQLFDEEKLRLTTALKNRGFAYFAPNFIEFNGDTTGLSTNVTVNLLPPNDTSMHRRYSLGRVEVFSSLVPDVSALRQERYVKSLYFGSSESRFSVNPERLYDEILLRPGAMYRQEDFDRTTKNLNSLGVFRFVSVKPFQDSFLEDRVNVIVAFAPNKRLDINYGVDVNSSTGSGTVAGRLLGLSAGTGFRNRNVFGGAELWQSDLSYNLELDPLRASGNLIFSQEFKAQTSLVVPRFFDYIGFWKTTSRLRNARKAAAGGKSLYALLRDDARTRLTGNLNRLQIFNFYRYNLLNASAGYDLQVGETRQYTINHLGIDLLQPEFEPGFDSIVRNNPFLERTFSNQLFTGFFLRSFAFNFNSRPNRAGERWFARVNTDFSGIEIYGLNSLFNTLSGVPEWRLGNLSFGRYLRLDMDGGYSREYRPGVIFASRIGFGVAPAFGGTFGNPQTPYVKQFFVGGPSSIRAWRIREIGPGRFVDRERASVQPFFQAGDVRLEFNAEMRFPLIWWIKGAVFLDGGNVWTLRADPSRPGSQFSGRFVRELALGTGAGLRFDFDYFVIRFDMGVKLRSPFPLIADNDSSHWYNNWSRFGLRDITPNLSVGYPF